MKSVINLINGPKDQALSNNIYGEENDSKNDGFPNIFAFKRMKIC